MTGDRLGVLRELVAGQWRDSASGEPFHIPIRAIEIEDSLDGGEDAFIRRLHGGDKCLVVCDEITCEILGRRVAGRVGCEMLVLEAPSTTPENADKLRRKTQSAEALIAVGSGTVNDLVKYATFLDGKSYSVFPTSPMNAYSTGTASLTDNGIKKSFKAHSASGVFFDLQILADCPKRLINNALSDVVCRTTAQTDWLLSRLFWQTPYSDIPYALLAHDEDNLFSNANLLLERDLDTLAALVRTCVLNGLGSAIVGTTHPGSMGEHMISHYLDMFAGDAHPGTLHGEQVGVATLSVLRLQNKLLSGDEPPVIKPTRHKSGEIAEKFGATLGREFSANLSAKSFDKKSAAKWNQKLAANWENIIAPVRATMLPVEEVERPMILAQAHITPKALGYADDFYDEAVKNARFIRDRFTILDIADDCGLWDSGE